jgi:hypothetical protein
VILWLMHEMVQVDVHGLVMVFFIHVNGYG